TPIKSEGSGNAGTSGSGLYSENNGSADGHFVYFGEAKVEQVRFRIQSVSGTILHEYFEDVYFTYTEDSTKTYSISNVVFDKPSPAIIHTVDTLNFTFNYSKPFGEVRIFARPMINGNLQVGSFSSTVKTYSDDTGETSDYISFVNESSFDQVRFQIKSTLNQLLFETFIDVDYTFILRPVTSEIFANVDGPDIYPVPSGGELNISVPTGTGFNYSIINLSGQIILKGFSNSNTSKIDIGNVPSGTYIAKIKYNDKQYSKLIIFE
ncbi:MAG: T9SS type A sorting domain-containing protein, partial [Prolixibacteraceae bacterium]|nr:T9SS type A sorting domain-containing protein [Prolixibacteraceae bacterium]